MNQHTERRCTKCGETKPATEYGLTPRGRDGLQAQCKACKAKTAREWLAANPQRRLAYVEANRAQRNAYFQIWGQENRGKLKGLQLQRRYGITLAQYEALLAFQGGTCAGCGIDECPTGRALSVDHDHGCCPATRGEPFAGGCGKCVRGLLCGRCNLTNALAGAPRIDWALIPGGAA